MHYCPCVCLCLCPCLCPCPCVCEVSHKYQLASVGRLRAPGRANFGVQSLVSQQGERVCRLVRVAGRPVAGLGASARRRRAKVLAGPRRAPVMRLSGAQAASFIRSANSCSSRTFPAARTRTFALTPTTLQARFSRAGACASCKQTTDNSAKPSHHLLITGSPSSRKPNPTEAPPPPPTPAGTKRLSCDYVHRPTMARPKKEQAGPRKPRLGLEADPQATPVPQQPAPALRLGPTG